MQLKNLQRREEDDDDDENDENDDDGANDDDATAVGDDDDQLADDELDENDADMSEVLAQMDKVVLSGDTVGKYGIGNLSHVIPYHPTAVVYMTWYGRGMGKIPLQITKDFERCARHTFF